MKKWKTNQSLQLQNEDQCTKNRLQWLSFDVKQVQYSIQSKMSFKKHFLGSS